MKNLTTQIIGTTVKVAGAIDKQYIKQRRLFHLYNAKELSKVKLSPPITGLEKSEIEARLLRLLYESSMIDIQYVTFNSDIRKDLYLDSLSLTMLGAQIQQEFGITFDDQDLDSYGSAKTLDEITQLLMKDQTAT